MSPAPMPMGFPYPGFAPHGMQPGGPFIAIRGPPEAEGVGPSSSSGGFEGDGDKERGEGEKNDQEEDEDLSSFHSCRSSLSRGPDQLESADPSAPSSLLPLDSMRAQPYGQKSHSALPNVFPRYNEGTQGDTFAAVRGGSSFRRDKMHHPSAGALPQVKIPTRPSGSSSQFPSKLQPRGSLRGGAPAQRGPPPPQWPPHLLPRFEGDQSSFSSASAFAGQGGPRFVSVDTGHVPSAAAASSRQLHVPPHGCNNPSPRESRGPARSPIAPVPTQSFYNKKDAGAPPAAEGGGTGLLKMMRNKKRPAEGPPPPVENPGGESSSSSASSSSSSHGVGLSAGGGVGGSTWHEFRDRTSVGSMQTENSTVMDLSSRLDLFKKRKLGGSQGNFPGGKEKEKKKKPPPNAKKEKKEKDKNRPTGSKSGTNLNKEKEARRPSLSVSARLSQESRSGSLSGQGGRKVKTRAPKRHAVPLAGPASAAIRVNAAQAASAALSSSHPHNPQQQQQASSAPGPQPRPPLPSSKSSSRPRTRESILAKGTRLRPQNTLRQTQRMNMSPSLTVGGGRRATLAPPSPSSSQQQQASASSGGGLKKPGGGGGGRGEMPKMAAAGGSAAGGPRPTRGRRRGRGAAAAVGRPPKIPAPPTTTASAPQSSSLAPPTTELHRQQKETKEPPQTETERLCVSSQQRRGVSVPASPSTRRRVRMGGPGPPDESPACAAAPLSLNAAAVGGGGDGLEKGGQSSRERECVSPSAEPENRCPTGSRAGGGGGGEAATFCQQKGAPRIQLGEMPGPLGGSNGAQQQQGAEGDSCPPISPRCGGNGKGGTGGRSPRLGRSPRGGTRASVFPPALSVDVPSAPGGAPSEAPHALVEGEGPRTGSSTDTAAGSTVAPAAMEVESDALADQKRKGGRAQDGANVKGDNEEEEGEEEKDVSPSASASPSSASGTGGQADIASRPLEVSS
uniref:Uncharacterized protein n=1 Tax=Chromera velia CCMP2878 TaxID=1169474 RepID=A0A0G4HZV0_9ALVE|eukprot:Cvel_9777.t1-p1 / transcript=Cvel_9777.t1 / gene=Cvel_9777 / organism=Chromera_velia_CCMP2878 / gene_product=hypothetical protein / transcript_product=hypothetical protein / location=Cvel_scaffold573:40188-43055(-) / protein_length=956 / sequence_SO=supercontig / SO=protein_coding / is_pseudo=false